ITLTFRPWAAISGNMASISVVLPLPERPAIPNTRASADCMGTSIACLGHDADIALRRSGKLMPLRLGGDTGKNQLAQFGITGPVSQGSAQAHLVFLAQTQVQRAIHAQAHSVAAWAEVL